MSSGGLFLLLGLLTLWAEMTPVSSTFRPRFCYLPPAKGTCNFRNRAFHYNPHLKKCQEFLYGGCGGNENRFMTIEACKHICAE
uniref:Kunitz peptide n=1 Tax=Calliophis bivirgatus TaxID=8633 RepID=A0A898IN80_CALBG|nr:kunitz peptide [Calliophis bivirgatus]